MVPEEVAERSLEVGLEPQPNKDSERYCCVRYVFPGRVLRVNPEEDRGVERALREY